MKNTLIILVFIFISLSVFSQDLIVTNEGDSLNCKITKLKKDNIYFTFKHKNEIRNTLLPLSKVKDHKFEFFQQSEVPKGKVIRYDNYKHFRFAFNTGLSYETAKISENIPPDFKDYVKDLKSGYHFGCDLAYYFSEPLGVGFKYIFFNTKNRLDNIYVEYENGDRRIGKMIDNIKISFIGPTFSTRLLNSNKKNAFLMNLSLGYMEYKNDFVFIDNYIVTGNTIGLALDLGYDITIFENLLIGFQLSFITGTISKFKWDDGINIQTINLEKGEYESLNRIDLSIGFRINK